MKHLRPELLPILDLSDNERIKHIKNEKWVGYSRAKYIMDRLEELLDHPITHRMPNLLIVGDTNNGKTVIVNKFEKQHPAIIKEEGLIIPVILIQAPPVPDEKRFFNAILDKLVVPYRINDRVERKQQQVLHVLKKVKLKILIIDEIHHILAGNTSRQRAFLNVIKFIANELQISIVGVGTRDALNALQTDQQLANRFEPLLLPKWHMNEEYLRLLSSFELMLPLKKPSHLTNSDMATKILAMSEGVLGEAATILKKAAVDAIKSGQEKITKEVLEKLDWRSPSERKTFSYKEL